MIITSANYLMHQRLADDLMARFNYDPDDVGEMHISADSVTFKVLDRTTLTWSDVVYPLL